MLSSKISVNLQVHNLTIKGRLLFTWLIPHSDDVGLLPFDSRIIKGLVVPMADDFSLTDVQNSLDEMVKNNLLKVFEYNGQKFYRLVSFFQNQTLKRDRHPQSFLDFKNEKTPQKSWEKIIKILGVEDDGIQMEDDGNTLDSEVKRREDKRSILNIIASPSGSAQDSNSGTGKKGRKKESSPEDKQLQKEAVELIEYWKSKWETSMGGKKATITAWGRFIKTAKQFLKIHGLPRMKMLCDAYFVTFDDQLIKANSWNLNIFLLDSTINKLNMKY